MSELFKNRVFGCALIKSINSNFNADFSHQPRTLSDGTVFATDKTLKYSIRNYIKKTTDEKLMFFKNFDDSLKPRTLGETYKELFGPYPLKSGKSLEELKDSDTFTLFEYDGEEVNYYFDKNPKKELDKYFKALEEDSDLQELKKDFIKLKGKEITQQNLKTAKNKLGQCEEPCFFYFEKEKLLKIDFEYEKIKEVAVSINSEMTGGFDRKKIIQNLFNCIDIRLFGATFADGGVSLSLHGPVQISYGVNRYPENNIFPVQISSPFRNSNAKSLDAMQTTLGTEYRLKEGHYNFHFSINPNNLNTLNKEISKIGLYNEDIIKLKKGLCNGVTLYDSVAKIGSENRMMLWVELKADSNLVLPSFAELLNVNKDANRKIDLSRITKLLSKDHIIKEIETIEIYGDKDDLENYPPSANFKDLY